VLDTTEALTVWHIAAGAQLTMVAAIANVANNTGPSVSDLRMGGNSMNAQYNASINLTGYARR
jgi:hypothetical protein